jgi:hypothetical protein
VKKSKPDPKEQRININQTKGKRLRSSFNNRKQSHACSRPPPAKQVYMVVTSSDDIPVNFISSWQQLVMSMPYIYPTY